MLNQADGNLLHGFLCIDLSVQIFILRNYSLLFIIYCILFNQTNFLKNENCTQFIVYISKYLNHGLNKITLNIGLKYDKNCGRLCQIHIFQLKGFWDTLLLSIESFIQWKSYLFIKKQHRCDTYVIDTSN